MLTKLQTLLLEIEKLVEGSTSLLIDNGYIEINALDQEESGFVSASIRQHGEALVLEITREKVL